MIRAPHLVLVVALALPAPSTAQSPAPTELAQSTPLPVRRVVLYKTGVGYFEHLGSVRDRQDVAIRFTSAQLNDVLKSLTTLDLGKGRISGISYNSIAPVEQRLGALRLPIDARATTFDLLGSLRGARIEVTSGATAIEGRLLSVERRASTQKDQLNVEGFSIVTDGGEVRTFDLTPSVRIRIIERDLRQEVARYLDVVGSSRDQDVRRMVISTLGTGDRQLFVSYISEVPIWKSTYRLVVPDTGKPLLQAWAIVDNTIGEDWNNVELSLVAGAPQSFIQHISQPYYGRRPVVPLPQSAQTTPQTHQATLSSEMVSVAGGAQETASVTRDSVIRRDLRTGAGGGVYSGTPGPPPPPASPARSMPYDQARDLQPAAQAAELGDLFEYRIKEPVTLRKNQSALVPIVNAEITAEKVALWNRAGGSGRPLRALWLTNGTGYTLDGGSVTVIDGNAFAGEGLVEPLKPGERRLVSYAAELGVFVNAKQEAVPGRITRVRARDGIVIHDTEERASWIYTARNENPGAVTLVVEHRTRPGWKLTAGLTAAETTPDSQRFRLTIEPHKEATLEIHEARSVENSIAITDLTEGYIASGMRANFFTEDLQRALKPILEKRADVAVLDRQLSALESQQQGIIADQQRLRENMKALRGSSEEKQLLQRYTRQLDDQENRLESLRRDITDGTAKRDRLRAELSALMVAFSLDVTVRHIIGAR